VAQQQTNGELAGFAGQVTTTARQAAQASAALSTVAQDLSAVVARLQESVAAFRVDSVDPVRET
jgi:ABC-type transporter Mla subunit MlaD